MAGSESSSQQARHAAGAGTQQPLDPQTAFYKTWQGFVELSYDLMVFRHLAWPSLTLQWLPGALQQAEGGLLASQRLLLGMQTSGIEPSAVLVYESLLPAPGAVLPQQQAPPAPELEVLQEVPHGMLDVNRARAMPHNPDIIATRSDSSDVLLFRLSSQAARQRSNSRPPDVDDDADLADASLQSNGAAAAEGAAGVQEEEGNDEMRPECRLSGGHSEGGFGLAWDPMQAGRLLTGGNDGSACVWDVGGGSAGTLEPLQRMNDYDSPINAVAWSSTMPCTYALVGEGGQLLLRDTRTPASSPPSFLERLHRGAEALTVDFDPCHEHWLAAGDARGDVAVVDLRRPGATLTVLAQHAGAVNAVAWNGHVAGALASASADGTVLVWDVEKVVSAANHAGANAGGDAAGPSIPGQAESSAAGARRKGSQPRRTGSPGGDGDTGLLHRAPPGLLFCHAGHMGEVADVSWNPDPARPWVLASVSAEALAEGGAVVQPHVLQVWEMAAQMRQLWPS